ncbi:GNAT family N-acetyltransferase [Labedaea rhizosphaerae]|uniref:Ribosomal protein S18 acetylase RimI-like enzyme n=1 Tax=Labedaea rhizosphaerae TaxID=598644 RepID=A0A4R6SAQ7_LABRH|nr:GNAT family N-acetyltransferase [Labedaea rhizosphaerae]TDP96036.1 ribosomal protein S18 acetylase RimI-like enzyme [Labedaea rhizosphaerae]
MTAAESSSPDRLAELSAQDLRARLSEALDLYVTAMRYPKGTAEQRAPMWLAHMMRTGWRCIGAFDPNGNLAGIAYGYRGSPGQWWHEQVRRGLIERSGPAAADQWTLDYFELTELHVRPDRQGRGTGENLLRALLAGATEGRVLLSTPEGPSRAWRLYRRVGFVDVLRDYQFSGDPRLFGVLGATLPLA